MTFAIAALLSFPNGFDWDSFYLGLLVAGSFMILFLMLVTALVRIGIWLSHSDEEDEDQPVFWLESPGPSFLPEYPISTSREEINAFYALSRLIEGMEAFGKYRLELRGDGYLYLRADVAGKKYRDYYEIPVSEVDWDNLTEHDLVFYQRRRIQSQRTRTIREEEQ